eukprot:5899008-Pyramimonas_sp.AAC.1
MSPRTRRPPAPPASQTVTQRLSHTPVRSARRKKNTLPLGAGGCGASTTMSSWGLGPRGHAV